MSRLSIAFLSCLIAILPAWPSADACTTFLFERGGKSVVGKSYDWDTGPGLAVVNKRGVAKQALLLNPLQKPAKWVSKYGSLTLNQYGREMPNGGMNEAGLVVEVMWLDSSAYPKAHDKPALTELQFIQYLLDNFATAAEVAEHASEVKVAKAYASVHYLACDRTGACVALEFLDGALVVTESARMPARVLTNNTYAESAAFLAKLRGFGGKQAVPMGSGSLERFARAASLVAAGSKSKGPLHNAAFAVLDSVSQGEMSQWNIVYDPNAMRIWFRTHKVPKVKSVELGKLDFACAVPAQILDIDTDRAGDVTHLFQDYSLAANEKLITETLAPLLGRIPAQATQVLARYPDMLRCTEATKY
ncbi:MAG: linear amide C-N hydrolase [Deltaproteobacteria bacterium]|nr:linear amide C-N hydrolase [Deltaproteobacteria bacterium]